MTLSLRRIERLRLAEFAVLLEEKNETALRHLAGLDGLHAAGISLAESYAIPSRKGEKTSAAHRDLLADNYTQEEQHFPGDIAHPAQRYVRQHDIPLPWREHIAQLNPRIFRIRPDDIEQRSPRQTMRLEQIPLIRGQPHRIGIAAVDETPASLSELVNKEIR